MPAPQLRQFEEGRAALQMRQGSDRRTEARMPARDIAEILTEPGGVPVSCMVRDLSAAGALIETGTQILPQRFVLINHVRKWRTVCRVAWREGSRLGVSFLTRPRSFG